MSNKEKQKEEIKLPAISASERYTIKGKYYPIQGKIIIEERSNNEVNEKNK
jgi:hypothetical protein